MNTPPKFDTEADLCSAFLSALPDGWTAYNETGFDILLAHKTGWQIGIEAKLTLNAKVLEQIVRGRDRPSTNGPDLRAVLVGRVVAENAALALALGITVITVHSENMGPQVSGPGLAGGRNESYTRPGRPLPDIEPIRYALDRYEWYESEDWFDEAPVERITLPDYVPDVAAGRPCPTILSDWKIKAIKTCIWVERHGLISRAQFRDLKISPTRWMDGHWLTQAAPRGYWRAGPRFPAATYRFQHPDVFAKIEADFDQWSAKLEKPPAGLFDQVTP